MTPDHAITPDQAYGYLFLMVVIYFLPAIVARVNHHTNTAAIFVLNLALGWTVLGWIGALVWAVMASQRTPAQPQPVIAVLQPPEPKEPWHWFPGDPPPVRRRRPAGAKL